MIRGSASPALFDVAALVAGLLMVVTGAARKRLLWRSAECPTCHRPRRSCSCRWR
ncbi:MAG TPA: hypothetical protein VLV46_05740 [Gaiellaceae bacterium]|nr:hypothetical protein [Gaiellaceae bacterium]